MVKSKGSPPKALFVNQMSFFGRADQWFGYPINYMARRLLD